MMGPFLAIGLVLLVWTTASVLWLIYQMMGLLNLRTGRKDNWITYLIAAPVVAIIFVVQSLNRKRK